jgi:hypothetical protein
VRRRPLAAREGRADVAHGLTDPRNVRARHRQSGVHRLRRPAPEPFTARAEDGEIARAEQAADVVDLADDANGVAQVELAHERAQRVSDPAGPPCQDDHGRLSVRNEAMDDDAPRAQDGLVILADVQMGDHARGNAVVADPSRWRHVGLSSFAAGKPTLLRITWIRLGSAPQRSTS